MVSSEIGGGNGLRQGTSEDESTHPAPDSLWARHLSQLRHRGVPPFCTRGNCQLMRTLRPVCEKFVEQETEVYQRQDRVLDRVQALVSYAST